MLLLVSVAEQANLGRNVSKPKDFGRHNDTGAVD